MGLRFVFGRGGSGKSTYLLNEIKTRVQDNETSPVILLVPEQYFIYLKIIFYFTVVVFDTVI